ncbi:AMP-binding protein [Parendozoicomonas haliclonae]|uniref:D-alanine-poly(Phosphoribitol) ligase subunit 1 n=2 Tax=Parendozoicomonas haliclonae TaxID=1960125 RepID=A0A1X7AFP8_9GAMM|nr:D-alanine-poly(phosphoribitol) ligase subunit 1 [Parendozoicomonas haliclonae]
MACFSAKQPFTPLNADTGQARKEQMLDSIKSYYLINCQTDEISSYGVDQNSPGQFQDIAYIIFTSGTTGTPKGVVISNKAINNMIKWMLSWPFYSPETSALSFFPFNFDPTIFILASMSGWGGRLTLLDNEHLSHPSEIINTIRSNKISFWFSTPTLLLKFLLMHDFHCKSLPSLSFFFLTGEGLPKACLRYLAEKFPAAKIHNAYGPTEAVIGVSTSEISINDINDEGYVPAGRPREDIEIFIDNPVGDKEGEIIIRSDYLASGYLKDGLVTSLGTKHNEYPTGDLGFVSEGRLYITGRVNRQFKYSGMRIDPLEIELAISDVSGVLFAKLSPKKVMDIVASIHADIVLEEHCVKEDMQQAILHKLQENFPKEMIPSSFTFTYSSQVKLTKNNKFSPQDNEP